MTEAMMRRKYTDTDVRSDNRLKTLAIEYLERYEGEFEFLVKMQDLDEEDMTVGMIRGVLNCMLVDPCVGAMPVPYCRFVPMPRELSEAELQQDINTIPEPKPKRYPVARELKSKFKMPFGISNHIQATVVHRVVEGPAFRYYPIDLVFATYNQLKSVDPQYKCLLRWYCKSYSAGYRYGSAELLTEEAAIGLVATPRWRWCKTCDRLWTNERTENSNAKMVKR